MEEGEGGEGKDIESFFFWFFFFLNKKIEERRTKPLLGRGRESTGGGEGGEVYCIF